MFRLYLVAVLLLAVLWGLGACGARISPSGRKHKTVSHFTFLINNNGPTKRPVYKRYLNYNKKKTNKFKPTPRQAIKV
jgi:hypothetical protein